MEKLFAPFEISGLLLVLAAIPEASTWYIFGIITGITINTLIKKYGKKGEICRNN